MKRIVFIALAVSSVLLLSTVAQAAPPTKYRIQDEAVNAELYYYDPAACVVTEVHVGAHETVEQQVGGPVHQRWLSVDLYTFNDCTFSSSFAEGYVQLNSGELEVLGSAKSARLQKSLVLQNNYTGDAVPVTLDLTWTAFGEPYRNSYHQANHSQFVRTSWNYTGVARDAEVTGSVTSGTTHLLPQSSIHGGTISTSNSGAVLH
ncbi:MAG TPA: hypothetical protein VEL74_06970 [Thermoanaerobaculia bacterium]|nr:hypothetical protein [Thermoanaerobaculia bacterium]